jgi:CopG family nickel-responsive transcriptional regulator
MSQISRFCVSIERGLLEKFDAQLETQQYPTRSKAVADLIRHSLVRQEWQKGAEIVGAIILVFDHHRRDLSRRLTAIQHDHYRLIVSSQHVHLDHDNCLEIIVVRGKPADVEKLSNKLKSAKGVKYASLAAASTGADI